MRSSDSKSGGSFSRGIVRNHGAITSEESGGKDMMRVLIKGKRMDRGG
jgi:hypothetical protein